MKIARVYTEAAVGLRYALSRDSPSDAADRPVLHPCMRPLVVLLSSLVL